MTTSTQLRNISVDLIERELIKVTLNQIDVIPRKTYLYELSDVDSDDSEDNQLLQYDSSSGTWKPVDISTVVQINSINNEQPTSISSVRFQTNNNFVSDTIRVYLNGIRLNNNEITKINTNTFEIDEAITDEDEIWVDYLKI